MNDNKKNYILTLEDSLDERVTIKIHCTEENAQGISEFIDILHDRGIFEIGDTYQWRIFEEEEIPYYDF